MYVKYYFYIEGEWYAEICGKGEQNQKKFKKHSGRGLQSGT